MSNQTNKKRANKKSFLFSILVTSFILIVLLAGTVAAADVGYILKYSSKADKQVLSIFKNMGLTYDLIEDDSIYRYDLSDYRFLFIGDTRLVNARTLPIYNYPCVIMNGYHGVEWGLSDNDGLSQLSADQPLSVKMADNGVKQVYTKSIYGGKYLYYYYMGDKNCRLNNFDTVARTWAGIGNKFSNIGDVIAVAPVGTVLMNGKVSKGNMCFYGMANTEFWTDDAKQMFKDCIGYVGVVCSQDSECSSTTIGQLYCKDEDVYQDSEEYKCQNPGTVHSECVDDVISNKIEDCQYGCLNGECKPQCTASDLTNCGDESYSNNYCKQGNVVKDHITPSCSLTKTCLINNNTIDVENCPFGCANGECIVQCSINSDCGTSGLLNQPYCKDNKVYDKEAIFTCNSPGTKNSYCSNLSSEKLIETCADECLDGECVTIECYNNSDCDDSNTYTEDICLNPGTPQSSCEHNLIKCFNNAECGTDGFIGNPICGEDLGGNINIFDKYITYTCLNPGTSASSCATSTEPKLFAVCSSDMVCSDGQCFICMVDSDCNDNNLGTEDKCLNPGTASSTCQNLPIKCSSNSQCGTDGFTGNKYCLGGDSYEDFVTYTCNNPNTAQSSCTSVSRPVLKKTCESECINGECITCFSDNDCGTNGFTGNSYCSGKSIFQNYKIYTCLNPGTSQSSCTDSDENKLKQTCPGACFKGQCKDVKCNSDVDCNDNDEYTEDECNNPGTTSSYCSNTLYNCITDKDCGITGFSGEETCMINNVFKMYYSSRCVNAMTTNSYCDNSVTQKLIVDCGKDSCDSYGANYCKNGNVYHSRTCYSRGCANKACFATPSNDESLIEQCSNGCADGKCTTITITCSKDSDCDDANSHTQDKCLNPGTSQSSCTHIPIICLNDAECNDNNPKTIDKCLNPGTIISTCTHTPVTCDNNAECGTNGFINGLFCQNNNVFQNYITYNCLNPGTSISSCTSSTNAQLKETCAQGQTCNNGACVSVTCDENIDCGIDGYLNQLFCKNNNVFDKYIMYMCHNPGTANSLCMNHTEDKLKQTCAYGCANGQCNQNPCLDTDLDGYDTCNPGTPGDDGNPSDCNDNNPNVHPGAIEICNGIDDDCDGLIDEGTNICGSNKLCVQGQCVPVNCNKNSDCGTNDYLNQLFCKNNNVFDKYITYTCLNPGLISSSCTSSTEDKLKQTCGQGQICSNGECETIICDENSDCGTNGFVDGLFCINTNIFQNYVTYTCENPGTIQSSCSSSAEPKLKQTCAQNQVCSNGECTDITCNINSDCGTDAYLNQLFCKDNNVFDKYKKYKCNNPGTEDSYCSNLIIDKLKETCSEGKICNNGECKNKLCYNATSPANTVSDIKFTPLYQTIDNSATNTFFVEAENLNSYAKTITYQKYECRCREHEGDSSLPPHVCLDYWPFMKFDKVFASSGGWLDSSCQLISETITLGSNEKKIIHISVSQYQNAYCGSFQTDLALLKVNDKTMFTPLVWSFADLCENCNI